MDCNFVIIFIVQICEIALLSKRARAVEYFQFMTDPVIVDQMAVSAAQMESQTGSGKSKFKWCICIRKGGLKWDLRPTFLVLSFECQVITFWAKRSGRIEASDTILG